MTLPAGRRIDAHLHVWDLDRSEYAWVTPGLGDLHATFTPEQARAAMNACSVDDAILVQAEDSERDTELMLEAAHRHRWIVGVVGWVRLDDPATAAEQLDRWQQHPAFCGVRHLVHEDRRENFLALPGVRRSLRLLARRGIPFEVPDAWPRHLTQTAELAAMLPDLQVIIDHLGKPPVGVADWRMWRVALAAAAAHPNCFAKVSGLQAPGRPFVVGELRPAWDAALELFGPERLMWGSDWPMTMRGPGYAGTWQVMSSLIQELSAHEQSLLTGGTAAAVYSLNSRRAFVDSAGEHSYTFEKSISEEPRC